jgi:hypothetical protein
MSGPASKTTPHFRDVGTCLEAVLEEVALEYIEVLALRIYLQNCRLEPERRQLIMVRSPSPLLRRVYVPDDALFSEDLLRVR